MNGQAQAQETSAGAVNGDEYRDNVCQDTRRKRGHTVWQTPRWVGLTPQATDGREHGSSGARGGRAEEADEGSWGAGVSAAGRRERGQTVWETPRGVGLTPHTRGGGFGGGLETAEIPGGNEGGGGYVEGTRRRERGQTVWQTPRGVGLTPQSRGNNGQQQLLASAWGVSDTPLGTQNDEEHRSESIEGNRRDRGQTVWQTPRGVGLTPRTTASQEEEISLHAVGVDSPAPEGNRDGNGLMDQQGRRKRGQTVWQTPRGVGLTPQTTTGKQERTERGQTVCQTPRGMGLTLARPHGSQQDAASGRGEGSARETPQGVGAPRQTPRYGSQTRKGRIENVLSARNSGNAFDADGVQSKGGHRLAVGRARGQTVWETPRGVGLTPRPRQDDDSTPDALRGSDEFEGPVARATLSLYTPDTATSGPGFPDDLSSGQAGLRSFAEGH